LDALNALVDPTIGLIILALAVACVALVVAVVVLWRRTSGLEGRLAGLTRGAEGQSLEAILDAHLDKVYAISRDVDDLATRSARLEAANRRAFQRSGIVRFNPFEDTGGNQSFALALLDADGNGLVMSSLHSRSGTRIYAKGVAGGRTQTQLSTEEAEALRLALASEAGAGTSG